MRTVFLHFRLFILLLVVFFCVLLIQAQYSIICLCSYKKFIHFFDKYAARHAKRFLYFARFILGIRFHIPVSKELKNTYKIASDKPYLVLSNHQSFLDILMLISMFRTPIRFVSKKVLERYIPYVSMISRAYRYALIDRKSGMKTIGLIKDLARRCRKNALPMVIFPEGTRSRSGNVQPFHSVGIRASLLDGPMDIIVIALDGGLFFPKFLSFPDTKNKRYVCMKVLQVFENVTKTSAERYVKKSEELIRDQVAQWRKERGIQFPITEYAGRRQRV